MFKSLGLHFLACVATAVAFTFPVKGRAEPTDLDASFGSEGIVRLPTSTWLSQQVNYPDGRIALLLAERAAPYAQSIIRLDASGRSDGSFMPISALPCCRIVAIAVAPNNRLATLQSFLLAPNGETWVTRHLDDGSLDSAFGQSGSVLVSRFPYYFHARNGVWGEFSSGLTADTSERLYTATELLDPSISATWITRIGATGNVVEQLNRSTVATRALIYGPIRIDSSGGVVALLHAYERPVFGVVVGGPALIRLIEGVPDRRFGLGGIAFHPMPNWVATYHGHGMYELATTPDGGYVVLGATQDSQIVVAKFTATGEVDATFGESGIALVALARPDRVVQDAKLAVQPDGRIVVAGTVTEGVVESHAMSLIGLGRLTASGQPDLQFAGGGIASFWVERGTAVFFLSVRPDGRILVAGEINPVGARSTGQPVLIQFLGGNSTRIRPYQERHAFEYFHAAYGHYFLTADPHEIANLDFSPGGWARTGHAIRVWDDDDASLLPVCRFWSGQSFAPKSSHFYTPYADECAVVRENRDWLFERNAFFVRMPEGALGSRTCPAGTQTLYRAYNNFMGGAPNHRYTTDPAVLDAMVAQGWIMEGEAATRVFACVPAP